MKRRMLRTVTARNPPHTLTRLGSPPSSGEPRRRQGTFRMRPALWFDRHGPGCGQTANIHFRAAAGIRAGRSIYRNRSVLAGGSQVPTMDGQLARRDCRIVVQPVVIDQLFMVWETAAAVRLRGARRFVKCGASRSTSRTTRDRRSRQSRSEVTLLPSTARQRRAPKDHHRPHSQSMIQYLLRQR